MKLAIVPSRINILIREYRKGIRISLMDHDTYINAQRIDFHLRASQTFCRKEKQENFPQALFYFHSEPDEFVFIDSLESTLCVRIHTVSPPFFSLFHLSLLLFVLCSAQRLFTNSPFDVRDDNSKQVQK